MDEQLQALLDFRFKGKATSCGYTDFDLPIVSQISGNLWSGASVAEFSLPMPSFFKSILNLFPSGIYVVPEGTTYREHKLYDSHAAVDSKEIFELADWAISRQEFGPVLVHCQAGINRSSLVMAAALMKENHTPEEAINLLRERRGPEALCNPVFERWVLDQDVYAVD